MIDNRYTNGIWWELLTGAFVTLEPDESANEILVRDEDGRELYRIDAAEFDPADYYRVPDEAVDDPVAFYREYADDAIRRVMELEPADIGARYARTQTKICAADE